MILEPALMMLEKTCAYASGIVSSDQAQNLDSKNKSKSPPVRNGFSNCHIRMRAAAGEKAVAHFP
jgi:hypothetical protein